MTETLSQDPPFAAATLYRGKQVNQWVIAACPHCGGKHVHGAGTPDMNPRDFLGHRVAHCCGRARPADRVVSGGYTLVEQGTKAGTR